MALSSALMNKGDYEYRKANMQLRLMAIQDELQRKQDMIKIVEDDIKRVTDAEDNWDKAVKADAQKDANNTYTLNRNNVLKSASYKFATLVGIKTGDGQAPIKLERLAANSTKTYDGQITKEDSAYLTQLQNEESSLDMEKESLDSQLETIEATLKGMDGLVSNAAQDNAFWAVGG